MSWAVARATTRPSSTLLALPTVGVGILVGQHRVQRGTGDAPEGPPGTVRVEDRDLERVGPEAAGLRTVAPRLEGVDGDLHRLGELAVLRVGLVELLDDRFGRAAHHHEMRFVGDRPVIGDAVELGRLGLAEMCDLGHAQLDLVGLGLLGEDRAERLRVHVRQLAAGDVTPVVGVAAGVGELDAAAPQVVELVEPADRGEPDPVVQLADLLQ